MKLRNSIPTYPTMLLLLSSVVVGYNNGLARTPQMGWNTWNKFGCDIDEELIVESAKVVAERLRVYGYECVLSPLNREPGLGHLLICSYRCCDGRLSVSLLVAPACQHLRPLYRLARCFEGSRHWRPSP